MPKPGDWMTHDYAGVPILLLRRADGSLGAFLNVCRHRGARVAEGCGSGASSFSCPYHGWTYGLDGALVARPEEASFAAAERATHGLRALPVVEKHGMIWVGPNPAWRSMSTGFSAAWRTISPPMVSASTTITKPACCGAR